MRSLRVELPGRPPRSYEIVVGAELPDGVAADLRELATPGRWAVISDDRVAPRYGEPLAGALGETGCHAFPAGESSKTRETAGEVQDRLIAAGVGRDAWLVAVGGGVVGDLAGYVAATLFRGVPYVQVPTTLLAMVDSSVGGKTGVDTPHGKNLVGAIHQPRRVLVDVSTLETLPDAELRAGLAEVIKYGVILDAGLFADLEGGLLQGCLRRDREALEEVVARCCALKAGVVAADEREADYRQILNFGHTVAHALEAARGYGMRHGEAVAVGMVAEWRLAERSTGAAERDGARLRDLCAAAGLPTEMPAGLDVDALIETARHDKKSRAGGIRCALPAEIGRMAEGETGWASPVSEDDLRAALS